MTTILSTKLKLRVPPLLLTIIIIFIMCGLSFLLPRISLWSTISYVLAIVSFCVGMYFCIKGVVEFRRHKTTVDPRFPEHVSSLVRSGIYSISRNPMYFGFLLFIASTVFALRSPALIVFVPIFILYMNEFQIKPEESVMQNMFGDQFVEYKLKVRRWL